MGPLYTQCPRCEFPVVVVARDRQSARRCRQCGNQFVPDAPSDIEDRNESIRAGNARGRSGLRALLKRARRMV